MVRPAGILFRRRGVTLFPPSYPRAYPLHHHLVAARYRGGERHRQGLAEPCRRRARDRGQASASCRRLERRMACDMNDRVPVMLACGVILAALFAEAHPDFIAHPPRSALEMCGSLMDSGLCDAAGAIEIGRAHV